MGATMVYMAMFVCRRGVIGRQGNTTATKLNTMIITFAVTGYEKFRKKSKGKKRFYSNLVLFYYGIDFVKQQKIC